MDYETNDLPTTLTLPVRMKGVTCCAQQSMFNHLPVGSEFCEFAKMSNNNKSAGVCQQAGELESVKNMSSIQFFVKRVMTESPVIGDVLRAILAGCVSHVDINFMALRFVDKHKSDVSLFHGTSITGFLNQFNLVLPFSSNCVTGEK